VWAATLKFVVNNQVLADAIFLLQGYVNRNMRSICSILTLKSCIIFFLFTVVLWNVIISIYFADPFCLVTFCDRGTGLRADLLTQINRLLTVFLDIINKVLRSWRV